LLASHFLEQLGQQVLQQFQFSRQDRQFAGQFAFDAQFGMFFVQSWGTSFPAYIGLPDSFPFRSVMFGHDPRHFRFQPIAAKLTQKPLTKRPELRLRQGHFSQQKRPMLSCIQGIDQSGQEHHAPILI
jgi:hypothetical protein